MLEQSSELRIAVGACVDPSSAWLEVEEAEPGPWHSGAFYRLGWTCANMAWARDACANRELPDVRPTSSAFASRPPLLQ